MKKPRARQARAEKRRQEILEAALQCFSELGYADATLEDIRQRSGASTGSIYHLFGSKEGLAAALYTEGLARYQQGFVAELVNHRRARQGIRALVRFHLGWVQDHPDWSRYLFQMRRAGFMSESESRISAQNEWFYGQVARWLVPHIRAGTLRRLQPDLYASMLLGPSQEFARMWLGGQTQTEPGAAARELGEAAWRSVRAPQK